jgi:Cu2+-exporting ATPase
VRREFCCPGCRAVAQSIFAEGLGAYYQQREKPAGTALPTEAAVKIYDHPLLQQGFARVEADGSRFATLIMEGITCAACVWLNERHVQRLPGVKQFYVNYATQRAVVQWQPEVIAFSEILFAIQSIGYRAYPYDSQRQEAQLRQERRTLLRRLAVAGLLTMQIMMISVVFYLADYMQVERGIWHFLRVLALFLTLPVLLYSGWPFVQGAWRSLKNQQFGMDVTVVLAVWLSFVASVWFTLTGHGHVYYDSVSMFIFFLLIARYFELQARQRAALVLENRLVPLPTLAHVARPLPEGENMQDHPALFVHETPWSGCFWADEPAALLKPGDRIFIKPGERIPADVRVCYGESTVNEALLTGEAWPVAKKVGDRLLAGSINQDYPLYAEVERVGQATVLREIQRLAESSQRERPAITVLANRFSSLFIAVVLLLTTLVGAWWWTVAPERVLEVIVAMLVVTCPCALSLAVPSAISAALAALTREGVLIVRANALFLLNKVDVVIFDKTGTLTDGQLHLLHPQRFDPFLLALAAALEQESSHPVAQAFLRLSRETLPLEARKIHPQQGVSGSYQGRRYYLGSGTWLKQLGFLLPAVAPPPATTLVYLAVEGQDHVLETFVFQEQLREDAKDLIQNLQQQKKQLVILSGDTPENLAHWQNVLGIPAVGGQTPAAKSAYLKQLQDQGHSVAMIGDGVNDAPVLAQANVSLALGSGAALAQNHADFILLNNRLGKVLDLFAKAQRLRRVVRENIGWAIGYNIVALPLAASGWLVPWMAALGMSASSLIVVLNALRLDGTAPAAAFERT